MILVWWVQCRLRSGRGTEDIEVVVMMGLCDRDKHVVHFLVVCGEFEPHSAVVGGWIEQSCGG